jgi:hypothetical protein
MAANIAPTKPAAENARALARQKGRNKALDYAVEKRDIALKLERDDVAAYWTEVIDVLEATSAELKAKVDAALDRHEARLEANANDDQPKAKPAAKLAKREQRQREADVRAEHHKKLDAAKRATRVNGTAPSRTPESKKARRLRRQYLQVAMVATARDVDADLRTIAEALAGQLEVQLEALGYFVKR